MAERANDKLDGNEVTVDGCQEHAYSIDSDRTAFARMRWLTLTFLLDQEIFLKKYFAGRDRVVKIKGNKEETKTQPLT